jgi:hypothetical protein
MAPEAVSDELTSQRLSKGVPSLKRFKTCHPLPSFVTAIFKVKAAFLWRHVGYGEHRGPSGGDTLPWRPIFILARLEPK